MKNKFTVIIGLLLIFICNSITLAQSEKYYICRTSENNTILLEDHYTEDKYFKETDNDSYLDYENLHTTLITILKVNGIYQEGKSTYYIDRKLSGFDKFTNIDLEDAFYLSAPDEVYMRNVKGYAILLDDQIGGGNMFYLILDNYGVRGLTEYSNYFIASKKSDISRLDTTGVPDNEIIWKFKEIAEAMTPKSNMNDEYGNSDQGELKVFVGSFVIDKRMQMRASKQYLVSYVKRTSFETYSSFVYVFDDQGIKLGELSPLQVDSFYYSRIIGIVDVNGDNRSEILIETGYYEGNGLDLIEFDGEKFIMIAKGFNFGV